MEQEQPLSKEKSLVIPLSGDAEGTAARTSSPLALEAKLSNNDHCEPAPAINPSNSFEKAPRRKPEKPKRNFNNTLATRAYGCKYCDAKFETSQALGGHQKAHRRQHAAERQAQAMNRMANAFSQVNPNFNSDYFGTQPIPISGQPVAYGPLTWSAPAAVMGPAYWGMLKLTTTTNPQTLAWHRPAIGNQLNGMVCQPMNYNGDPDPNFGRRVSPQSTGPTPPLANVVANGSSLSTQGLETEGLDLSLRL
ncbi:uncharacterized protein J3R85_012098 [Psidium guajava]|nr:uncharacterized protein J3R85_012098 [Psidium guajava]